MTVFRLESGTFHLTTHVQDSYRIFYMDAEDEDIIQAVEDAEEIEPTIALRMVGRRNSHAEQSGKYRLHRQRTGIFVVAEDCTVITFLRFYSRIQYDLAIRLYGEGDPLTLEKNPYADPKPEPEPEPPEPKKTKTKTYPWRDREIQVLGVPVTEIAISEGVRKALGGKDQVRDALYRSLPRDPTEEDLPKSYHAIDGVSLAPSKMFEVGDKLLALYEEPDGTVRVVLAGYNPKPKTEDQWGRPAEEVREEPILWVAGQPVELRDLRISGPVLDLAGDFPEGSKARTKLRWDLRKALRTKPPTAVMGEDGWRVSIPFEGEDLKLWVFKHSPGKGEDEWWVSHSPPFHPDPEHEKLAEILREAGWVAEPPVWVAGG